MREGHEQKEGHISVPTRHPGPALSVGHKVGVWIDKGKELHRDEDGEAWCGIEGRRVPSNLTVKRVCVKILFVNGLFRLNGTYSQNVPFVRQNQH